MVRDAVGQPEPEPAPGRNRRVPKGAEEVPQRHQTDARRTTPRQQDERVPRLFATVCRPQARGPARQVCVNIDDLYVF